MNDEAFAAYVINQAPRYELETLETIIKGLLDNISSRRWGKPAGLTIGSKIEATMFDTHWSQYGIVVSMSPKSCTIEDTDSDQRTRLAYSRYSMRIIEEFEWNRICYSLQEHRRESHEAYDQELRERVADREEAIRDRTKASQTPRQMHALNGLVELFRGAFVHAYRPDTDMHEYGVVVELTPKKCILSNPESDWEPRIWLAKHEVHLLTEEQWATVDVELRRRRTEYEGAEGAGKTRSLPDYGRIEIPLQA
jgi:hypothetical protein